MISSTIFLPTCSVLACSKPCNKEAQLPAIPLLPPELLGSIVYHIQCRNTLSTLATLAPVLQEEAERVLYRFITIQSAGDLQSLCGALLLGKRNVGRCNFVRSLEIDILADQGVDLLRDIHRILSTTINLTTFRLWPQSQQASIPLHQSMTSTTYPFRLKTLGMGESDLLLDQFLQFIRSQPSIEILEIYPDLNANSSHPLDLLDLPKDVLPNLTKVAARVSSVLRLVPGRPVTSVILRDWLEMARVVQFAKSLAVSTASVTSVKCLMSVVAPHFFETLGRHVPNLATLDLEVAFSLRGYELASIASQIPRMQSLQSLTISGFRTARFVSLAPSPADDAILFAERFKISFPSLTEFTLVSKTGIGRSADCATCVLSDKHGWSIDEEFIVVDGDKDSKWKTCINATF